MQIFNNDNEHFPSLRAMTESDEEILAQLMIFTTVDLVNVTAYLAMSLGEQLSGPVVLNIDL